MRMGKALRISLALALMAVLAGVMVVPSPRAVGAEVGLVQSRLGF